MTGHITLTGTECSKDESKGRYRLWLTWLTENSRISCWYTKVLALTDNTTKPENVKHTELGLERWLSS